MAPHASPAKACVETRRSGDGRDGPPCLHGTARVLGKREGEKWSSSSPTCRLLISPKPPPPPPAPPTRPHLLPVWLVGAAAGRELRWSALEKQQRPTAADTMAVTGRAARTRRGCRAPSGEPVAGGARSGRFGGEATKLTRTSTEIFIVPLGEVLVRLVDDPLFSTDPRWRCSRRSFFSGCHGDRQAPEITGPSKVPPSTAPRSSQLRHIPSTVRLLHELKFLISKESRREATQYYVRHFVMVRPQKLLYIAIGSC
ncbi:uncharacterized protein LOC125550753 isoform X2 [Triticum urartu]|uniref:uncharacterized protein LOC125550753 isoform X2 n=1 Tax=Triticum urartu TaxID=4572 RepID=UPI00204326B3|nr:uncharacterized protein LOC125550753 isoform X2 [Triticum urartu]